MSKQPESYLALRYIAPSPSGKTHTFCVENHRGETLGGIQWYGAWRQYVFYPNPGTIWSAGCLAEVQKLLADIHTHVKADLITIERPLESRQVHGFSVDPDGAP